MSRRQLLLTVFTIFNCDQSRSIRGSFINIDDILNENLMPSALFASNTPSPDNKFVKDSNITRNEFFNVTKHHDFSSAFGTMKFHRKMMNEFQATTFLANQVMGDFMKPQIGKRIGHSSDRQNMLFDTGSSSYKNWLEKTTTLDDVRNHFTNKTKRKRIHHNMKRRQVL